MASTWDIFFLYKYINDVASVTWETRVCISYRKFLKVLECRYISKTIVCFQVGPTTLSNVNILLTIVCKMVMAINYYINVLFIQNAMQEYFFWLVEDVV